MFRNVLTEPIAGRNIEPGAQKVLSLPHHDFVPFQANGNHIEGVVCEYLNLCAARWYSGKCPGAYRRRARFWLRCFPVFLWKVLGKKLPIGLLGDGAEVLTLRFFCDRKACPFCYSANLVFRILPKGKKKMGKGFLRDTRKEVSLIFLRSFGLLITYVPFCSSLRA